MKLPTSLVDLIFLDVDGRDESSGISAPPQAFTTLNCLQSCWDLLAPGGLLAINVVAKRPDALAGFLKTVCQVFRTKSAAATTSTTTSSIAATKEADIRDMIRGAISGDIAIDFDRALGDVTSSGGADEGVEIDVDIDDGDEPTSASASAAAGTSPSALTGTVFLLNAEEEVVNQALLCIKGSVAEPGLREAFLRKWLSASSGSDDTQGDVLELLDLLPLLTPL